MPSTSPTDPAVPSPSSAQARRRRILARLAFIAAVLLTLVAGFYIEEGWRGRAAWNTYQAEARSRGVKLTLAEFVPPPIPAERNFAAIPLFEDVFRPSDPPSPLKIPPGVSGFPPPFNALAKGQQIDLAQWQKHFVTVKFLPTAGADPAADVLQALEHYAPQFEQLREAAVRPECRFPLRYEDGAATRLPHLQVLQQAAALYSLRLSAHLALHRSEAAYEDFRAAFRLYEVPAGEPTLITALVRLSILAMLENAVWGGLESRQWNTPELEKIVADLNRVRLMDDYTFAVSSERGFQNLVYDQFQQKDAAAMSAIIALGNPDKPRAKWVGTVLFTLYPSGWLRFSQTRANRYIDEMLARVEPQSPRILSERTVPSNPEAGFSGLDRLRYLLFSMAAPVMNTIERSYAYGQTLLDETRLACALEQHRLAQGSFPATLEALAPGLIPTLPRDVMNGEPLHYRVEAGGQAYTLYGVGTNRQDDGGHLDPKKQGKAGLDWTWTIHPPKS